MLQAFCFNNNDINTKYCVLQMLHETMNTPEGQATLAVRTNEDMRLVLNHVCNNMIMKIYDSKIFIEYIDYLENSFTEMKKQGE